ncbi:MAG: hypothetical protein PHG80_07100 [Methanoregulaceae archaeon]|nr:hypothetical protein [Methanoregulaceae archaeon]
MKDDITRSGAVDAGVAGIEVVIHGTDVGVAVGVGIQGERVGVVDGRGIHGVLAGAGVGYHEGRMMVGLGVGTAGRNVGVGEVVTVVLVTVGYVMNAMGVGSDVETISKDFVPAYQLFDSSDSDTLDVLSAHAPRWYVPGARSGERPNLNDTTFCKPAGTDTSILFPMQESAVSTDASSDR